MEPGGLTRRQFTALGLASALAVLVSCGSDDDAVDVDTNQADVDRKAADPALATDVVAATNRFAADLYALAVEGVDNLAFSPLSIAIALAMTSEGARGTSREQIEDVFHLTDVDDVHGGWNAVDQALESRAGTVTRDDGSTDELALTIVNQLWAQDGFTIEDAFLAVLAASYGAGVNLLDFETDPEACRVTINAWVADQTNDRIPELIAEGIITDLTRLVLSNAVYFKAPWAAPFEPDATSDGPFTLLDGSTVDVPMMTNSDAYGLATGDGWQAIELAYADHELEMVLVVPDEGRFTDVEAQLGTGLLDEVAPGLDPESMSLTMPSFEIRTPLPLREPLIALGMPDPFAEGVADFSGINPDEDLFISDVVHEAFIAVDETGTEAAAATAVVVNVTSGGPSLSVTVDRPFLWAIRDVPTGAVLFLGRVVDPSIPA